MPYYSNDQIAGARQLDLLTYLRLYEPNELVHVSGDVYSTRTHDSLKISNGKWMWWSKKFGGASALDYLIKVRGKTFVEAMQILTSKEATKPSFLLPQSKQGSSSQNSFSSKKLLLPDQSKRNDEVIEYLKSRGIDSEIIEYCIDSGLLYESLPHHNCVFVGYDEQDKARYAFYRSTTKSRDMGEASGSDKRFCFKLGQQSDTVHVFEGILDLLSYATFSKMGGLDWQKDTLLSLGGVYASGSNKVQKVPIALGSMLERRREICKIVLHLDNDFVGRQAAESIKRQLQDRYSIRDEPPPRGKDYNEYLISLKRK